ncbi:MAG: hypothetical protein GX595_18655 [Lentisphaerae bacterium]|nr:hypothetical protein [Lentisphaerota bacterium]
MTARAFTFRTAQGVWINDMRHSAMPHQKWPCVTLDDDAVRDLAACMRLQAEAGFNSVTLFGLLTAQSWNPDLPRTVDRERARRVRAVLAEARSCGLKVLYGLGVYSWGFDEIIARDAAVRGPNPHAMCGSRPESWAWMTRIIDYLLNEFDFGGFHLEASDLGRCSCGDCAPESNTAYYSRLNARTAEYLRKAAPEAMLMVNMCGYLPRGTTVPRQDWPHLIELGRHLDFLVDPGHTSPFIEPAARRDFIQALPCAFGTSGGIWVYPPQRWNRQRWFIPYTARTGRHLEDLHADGGRAVEYYMGPIANPGTEVNIAFGGRKLADVGCDNRDLLSDVLDRLYRPASRTAHRRLVDVFTEAEEAFFAALSPAPADDGRSRGQIHLAPLAGTRTGPPIYLQNAMDAAGREAYRRRLAALLPVVADLENACRSRARVRRIAAALQGALADINRVQPHSATPGT